MMLLGFTLKVSVNLLRQNLWRSLKDLVRVLKVEMLIEVWLSGLLLLMRVYLLNA